MEDPTRPYEEDMMTRPMPPTQRHMKGQLKSISDALHGILSRLLIVEQRLDMLDGKKKTTVDGP